MQWSPPFGRLLSTSLKTKLQREILISLKTRDSIRASVLKQIHAELVKANKSNETQIGEYEILWRCANRWKNAIEEYNRLLSITEGAQKTKLQTIIDRETSELEIIRSLLPSQYTEEELKQFVNAAIDELEARDLGHSRAGEIIKVLLGRLDTSKLNKQELAEFVKIKLSQRQQ